jgi:hypothetical protein
VDAPIPGHGARRMVKERDVVCYRLDGLPMLVGMLQDLIARDDAALDFIEDDVAAKFDLGSATVSEEWRACAAQRG